MGLHPGISGASASVVAFARGWHIIVNSFTERRREPMSFLIAMAGKGGTGKTTTAGMLLRYLVEQGKTPVLAVDADANSNFNEVLGLSVELTVGQAREEMKKGGGLVDLTKDQLIEMRINQALVEADGFDLISMGQPEGPGCYCAANHMVARFMDILGKNYPFILMDNEAGMEHMSRSPPMRWTCCCWSRTPPGGASRRPAASRSWPGP